MGVYKLICKSGLQPENSARTLRRQDLLPAHSKARSENEYWSYEYDRVRLRQPAKVEQRRFYEPDNVLVR